MDNNNNTPGQNDNHADNHVTEVFVVDKSSSGSGDSGNNGTSEPTGAKKHWKLAVFVVFFLLIAIAGAMVINNSQNGEQENEENIAIRVGETQFDFDRYNELKAQAIARGIQAEEFNDLFVDALVAVDVASDLEIEATDDEVRQFFAETLFPGFEDADIEYEWLEEEWVDLYIRYQFIVKRLEAQTGYRGAVFPFTYSRYMETPIGGPVELTGNEDAINLDKNYALEQAEKFRQEIESNPSKEKAEEIINFIQADQVFGSLGHQATVFGYDVSKPFERIVSNDLIAASIVSSNQIGVSDVMPLELTLGVDGETGDTKEAAYYFIWLESLPNQNIKNAFDEASEKIEVFVNPEVQNG